MKDQNILVQNGVDLSKSIELFGDFEMYDESLGDFMSEINEKMTKLDQAKAQSDMPNYAILVHSLKSDAKYFGFTRLAELAYAHELKSKDNNIGYVNGNYQELVNETNKMIGIINRYLSSGGGAAPSDNPPVVVTTVAPNPLLSILVVDDSDIIKNYTKKIFSSSYNVITASDGAEAIMAIEGQSHIAAVLLDLNMPNVDGFKVLDYMRENDLFKRTPVSIITGNDAKEVDYNAFEYPIVDILKKPFTETAIKNIVEKTINNKKS